MFTALQPRALMHLASCTCHIYARACRTIRPPRLAQHTGRCPWRCVSKPDAYSILRKYRICACVPGHARSKAAYDKLKHVQGNATASPDAFGILRMSEIMRLHVEVCEPATLTRHTENCPGHYAGATLAGVQGSATTSPDAFSNLLMSQICACMSNHACQLD